MNHPALKQAAVINGLNMDLLTEAAEGIASDPQKAQVKFKAKSVWQEAFRSRTEVDSYELAGERIARRHVIHADEPLELLGGNQAPNPQELILAALNACMMVGFVAAASQAGVRIDQLEIESECALDLRGAFGLDPEIRPGTDKIKYTIKVKGSGSAQDFAEVHKQMSALSPNRFHITSPIPLESSLVVL